MRRTSYRPRRYRPRPSTQGLEQCSFCGRHVPPAECERFITSWGPCVPRGGTLSRLRDQTITKFRRCRSCQLEARTVTQEELVELSNVLAIPTGRYGIERKGHAHKLVALIPRVLDEPRDVRVLCSCGWFCFAPTKQDGERLFSQHAGEVTPETRRGPGSSPRPHQAAEARSTRAPRSESPA